MTQTILSKPRLPDSFVRYIRLRDEWSLFSVTLVAGGSTNWAYISGLPPLMGRPDAWTHLFQEWRRLERWCFHDGIHGWYCVTQPDNLRFIRWLWAIGARPVREIEGRGTQFQKSIVIDPAAEWGAYNMRDLATFIRRGRPAHA